jgi:hypothetical protein
VKNKKGDRLFFLDGSGLTLGSGFTIEIRYFSTLLPLWHSLGYGLIPKGLVPMFMQKK